MKKRHQNMIAFVRNQKHQFRKNFWWSCFNPHPEYYQLQPHVINALYFLSIETPLELARILDTSFLELEYLINNPDYAHFKIPKKRGGTRDIYVPSPELKRIHKRLNHFLQAYCLTIKPAEVHGFVINPGYLRRSCNIVENAKPHVGRKHILNLDLQDFFPGITAGSIRKLFLSEYFLFKEELATALALLVSYRGRLPVGAPASPAVSNFICLWLDQALADYCLENQIAYTRYADDLSFSSDKPFTDTEIQAIKAIIEEHQFRVNERKTRMSSANRRQTVTGLVVNRQVNVDRRLVKRVRAILHHWKYKGIAEAALKHYGKLNGNGYHIIQRFRNRIAGYIDFIGQVKGREDQVYLKLANEFRAVTSEKYKQK